ncbi:hypothetical protein GIB67_034168 [Kingdonia uniflora]|uniref:ATP-dependent DNA helicase n=1 Tax=Kingdonia uniflora TaxID=39325 RepID=A0A7J7LS75_9MAGN|nr:hypothetical protein GIB67_034168 [Kingdonia uniflora]
MYLDYANPDNTRFTDYLMEIGSNPEQTIQLPSTIHNCASVQDLILSVYSNLNISCDRDQGFLTERTILFSINDDVSSINDDALNIFLGETIVYLAADKIAKDEISLTPSTTKMPYEMTRGQFPLRLAYAMTINKSQGQSVKYVGIDLRIKVFSHGQLYVALPRYNYANIIITLLPPNASCCITNIVYPKVLL